MAESRRRADAVQNRDRILEVAREQLLSSDDVRLNAIAKAAGVGQGTLYRHFPTREHLLAEVYRADVEDLTAAAPALLTEFEPAEALSRWFDRVAEYARVKRGVFSAVEVAVWRDLSAHSLGPIGDAVSVLLAAGRDAGQLRDDVDARDVILLIGYLTRLEDAEWEQRAQHLLQVILDGLRVRQSHND
ncbi:TetR/AcrR family transcriptional regulator [Mycolicibacterium tokaiense]|uniref:TetR family transcriptional regulator n=1 Tax=Mycolicibacterium tokaiense TaxID=39695 RepID=A0A378TPG9_9MYCO|nr:TetR/AcrR family transcriptional regulator [Mycolicibacterium tokaiense]BBY89870.1 TetR family transcriptional regulator [Mycolicibacterium tokaiense]STZ61743.1 TetR family transcriptional regulator [Mycolicibacterium tokaiense]